MEQSEQDKPKPKYRPKAGPGRPLGGKNKPITPKDKMMKQLKRIWSNLKANKPSEVISAASLYAELQGWKLKKPETTEGGEIMRVEFSKDVKQPPKNKMVSSVEVTKEVIPEITTTTTQNTPISTPTEVKQEVNEAIQLVFK